MPHRWNHQSKVVLNLLLRYRASTHLPTWRGGTSSAASQDLQEQQWSQVTLQLCGQTAATSYRFAFCQLEKFSHHSQLRQRWHAEVASALQSVITCRAQACLHEAEVHISHLECLKLGYQLVSFQLVWLESSWDLTGH